MFNITTKGVSLILVGGCLGGLIMFSFAYVRIEANQSLAVDAVSKLIHQINENERIKVICGSKCALA